MKYLATLILSVATVVAILLFPFLSTGVQAAGEVDLSLLPASQTVQAGSSFNVDVQIKCNGQEVDGLEVFLDFNPEYLEVQTVMAGNTLGVLQKTYDNLQGTLDYAAFNLTPPWPSNTFVLASITFKTKSNNNSVTTPLNFHITETRITMVDFGGENVSGSMNGATVTVQNNPVTPATTTSSPVPSSSSPSPSASTSPVTTSPTTQAATTTPVQTGTVTTPVNPVPTSMPATVTIPTGSASPAPTNTASPAATTVPNQSTAPVTITSPIQTPGQTTNAVSPSKTSTVAAAGTSTATSALQQTAVTSTSSPLVPPTVPTTNSSHVSGSGTNWNLVVGIIGAVLIIILVLLLVYWKRIWKKAGK
jgi:hypothetical protein